MPVLRFVFLALLTLGITGMHTLGHPGAGHGPTSAMAAMTGTTHEAAAPAAPARPASTHPSAGEGTVARPGSADDVMVAGLGLAGDVTVAGLGAGLDPMTVCLAILGTATVAPLLLASVALAAGAGHMVTADPVTWAAGRGPPPPAPRGLLMADLSVLRI
ncbi:hypothetical protein R8Z50_23315 [Longispora sp. K20-0274]|uniref:hypothetical protein n=1 Tax=Longispora sp. K20-0274 TaxID=3088255 RepID=UPI00399C19C1